MHKQQINLIDKDIRALSGLPVLSDPVEDGVQYDQHADGSKLLAEFEYVVADQSIAGVHIRLLREGVERASGEKLKLECQRMRLRLRLFQKLLSEVCQCRRRAHIVALLVVAVHVLCAAVYDRLLALLELVPRHYLLAERLQELALLDDRISLAIVSRHIHRVDVVRRVGGYVDHASAERSDERSVLRLRVDDNDVRIARKHQIDYLVLRREGLASTRYTEDE